MRVLDNVRQVTIQPIIEKFIKPGTLVNTDEYDIYCQYIAVWQFINRFVRKKRANAVILINATLDNRA